MIKENPNINITVKPFSIETVKANIVKPIDPMEIKITPTK